MTDAVEKLVTDVTYCKKLTINSTSFVKASINNNTEFVAKLVEVKNRSGVDIFVKPNDTDEFPLLDGEDRVIMTKTIGDIKLALQSAGTATIHLLIEN
jgi:hypothetical protein